MATLKDIALDLEIIRDGLGADQGADDGHRDVDALAALERLERLILELASRPASTGVDGVKLANLGAERALIATGQHARADLDLVTFDYVMARLTS